MIAIVATVTPALLALLASRNDDGTPELHVERSSSAVAYRCEACGHETLDPYDDHECCAGARIATVFSVEVLRAKGFV